jgi:hypothetical protein
MQGLETLTPEGRGSNGVPPLPHPVDQECCLLTSTSPNLQSRVGTWNYCAGTRQRDLAGSPGSHWPLSTLLAFPPQPHAVLQVNFANLVFASSLQF